MSDTGDNSEDVNDLSLKKTMGMWSGVSVIFGSVVGSGIFISPNQVVSSTGSVGATLLIWALCGILIALGSMQYIELGCAMPTGAGGDYEYLQVAFGPLGSIAGFAFSFARLVLIVPSALAVAGLSLGNYILLPVYNDCPIPQSAVALIGAISILFFAYLNCRSTKIVNKIQLLFGVGKALALVLVVVCGIVGLAKGGTSHFDNSFDGTASAWSVVTGFYGCIFTYAGWNYLNFVIEELKEPEKNLPRAATVAIGMIAILYILVNVGYFALLTKEEILASNAVAVDALQKIWNPLGIIVAILVSLSVFGFINSMLFTTSRVVFSAARNNHLPAFLSFLHCKHNTPIPSVMAVAGISMLYMAFGSIQSLVYIISFCEAIFLVFTFIGFLVLRFKRSDMQRPFKAFLPFVLIYGLTMIFIVSVGLKEEYKFSLISVGITAIAIILFLILPRISYPVSVKNFAKKSINTAQTLIYSAAPAKQSLK